jgi:hypothetical protein
VVLPNHNHTVERLSQIRTKARNAIHAELLLSHLAIFQTPFGRSAVVGMAPEGMDKDIYTAAFATLRSWNIVKQVSSKRFIVAESVRTLFPPTHIIRMRQLTFFADCVSVYDRIWAGLRWDDLSSSLQWGLTNQPVLSLELAYKMRHHANFSLLYEEHLMIESMYRQATLQGNSTLQTKALEILSCLRF